jgi:hypothetical protein
VLTVPLYIVAAAIVFTTTCLSSASGQSPAEQVNSEADTFFSGHVVEMAADHVTVSRTVLGKTPEKRTFKITPDTKMEGKMKNKSRVTVRYTTTDDGEIAISIIVRPDRSENSKKR